MQGCTSSARRSRIRSRACPARSATRSAPRSDGATVTSPNRFIVGLAVLGLLSEVAEQQPLLWIVDDAQWLDEASSQTLAFVARRLGAESVAMVVAMRDPDREDDFARLDELVVHGLGQRDARGLLETVLTGPLDDARPRSPRCRDTWQSAGAARVAARPDARGDGRRFQPP